ncbi:MAG: hypothetical protein ACM3KM_01420 [Acidobacteriaceae bacterium]
MALRLSLASRRTHARAELAKLGITSVRDFIAKATENLNQIEAVGARDVRLINPARFDQTRELLILGVLVFQPTGTPTGHREDRSTTALTGHERHLLSALGQRAKQLGLLN